MSDVMEDESTEESIPRECLICRHMGGEHTFINSIPEYVSENIDKVDLDEICKHISSFVRENGMQVDAAQIRKHLTDHICDKKIIMNGIIHDLRSLMKSAMQHSVIVNEETSQSSIDHKACSLYLDTVKQIVSLYRTV